MNVCMLSYSFYESDTRILQYTSALVERGDTVDVIALRREGAPSLEVLDGVNVFRIQTRAVNEQRRSAYLIRLLRFLMVATFVLAKKHWSRRYDVVHVHSVPDFLVFAAIVPKIFGARIILDIHDILPEFYASKFSSSADSLLFKVLVLVERLSAAFADHVIIANHIWQERLLARSVKDGKCTTIVNYPDTRIFYPRARNKQNGQFTIIYPGSLNRHQGLDVAIRAFARVANDMTTAEFHIYGEGQSKPELIQLVTDSGLANRVIFHNFLPTSEIAQVMAASDLAVVPKRASSLFGNEAASTKITEFMALGVPLVVSRTRIDTYYHDDSMVKFFESENEAELANCMFELWQNKEMRDDLVANASRYVEKNNWTQRKHDYLDIVDALAPRSAAVQNCENQC